jgi:hypothetical protein
MDKLLEKMEYAGWGFFAVACIVLAGPGVWLSWSITNDTLTMPGRIVAGILMAIVAAAFVTVAANSALQARNAKREEATRESDRKARKRTK